MKVRQVTYRQQAQPRQYESLAMEATVDVEEGESLEAAAAALGARVRQILAAQLELARGSEHSGLIGEGEPDDNPI